MKILAVTHALPSRRISNDDVLRAFRVANSERFGEVELAILEAQVRGALENAGTRDRYSLAPGELAVDFALDATRRALRIASVPPEAIDFVIYGGVGRALIEPAMVNVLQAELGLVNATGFDIVDGCASWLRALQIAERYLDAGGGRYALLVNCECGFGRYIHYDIARPEDLEYHFATFTVSEAATATVVEAGGDAESYFTFRNFGEHYDLCMLPIDDGRQFLRRPLPEGAAPMHLFSMSRRLLTIAADKIVDMFQADPMLQGRTYDICFGHAASKRAEEGVLRRIGFPVEDYVGTHAIFGNTVSASVPLGMSVALETGRLRRGQRVLVIVAAGGIVVGLGRFTF